MLRQSASPARQREALLAFGVLENANIHGKASLTALQFRLLVHAWRGGFKGCQAFALAEEKLLKRYIHTENLRTSDLLGGLGFHSILLPKKN